MSTIEPKPTGHRLSMTRVGTSVWILRPEGPLDPGALDELRRAFREAISKDARDIVVDLGVASTMSAEAAAALSAIADAMIARDGVLWISIPWSDSDGFTLRPIRNGGIDGLLDVGALLGEAAERSAESSGGAPPESRRGRNRHGGLNEREDT